MRLGWGFDKITKDPKQNVNIKKNLPGMKKIISWQVISFCYKNVFMFQKNVFLWQDVSSYAQKCLPVTKKHRLVTRYIFLLKEMSFDKTYLYLWQEITSNSNKSQPVTRNYLLCGGDHSCGRQHLYFKILFCVSY